MKSLPRVGREFLRHLMVTVLSASIPCLAQAPPAKPKHAVSAPHAVLLQSVRWISDSEGPALEIVTNSSQALSPTIESLDSPPRLVIDLPRTRTRTRTRAPHQLVAGDTNPVTRTRINQFQDSPPVTRIVLDLVRPVGYSTDGSGKRLLVHLHPLAEAKERSAEVPSVSAFTEGAELAALPISASDSGIAVEARTRLARDSSVAAGVETTLLRLAHGKEVRVCPRTTLSVTTSENGRDLMLGMSTGALEARYPPNSSADSVLTPDFRMMLTGPGELQVAISADSRGNTCVRALPGNSASVMVSELMGEGTYQVKPNEQIVFRAGRLNQPDKNVPDDCGCPLPPIPAMRAAIETPTVSEKALPPTVHLAEPGDEAKPSMSTDESAPAPPQSLAQPAQIAIDTSPADAAPLPAPEPGKTRVQVEAPFVFRAADLPPSAPSLATATLPMSRPNSPAPMLTIVDPQDEAAQHKGVFGKMKGFFSRLFK
jgi:AMIN domain